jgi:uncharacterized cupin superfamily protein
MTCFVVDASTLTVDLDPVPAAQVIAGSPRVGTNEVVTFDSLEVGVWEHTAGTSTDVEVDEVFVVLSGRATVTIDDGPTLELRAGVVGFLDAGARTTWTVHEPVRKVYVLR